MDKVHSALNEAVDAVVNSFKKHSAQNNVNVVEALQEFWDMKQAQGANVPPDCVIQYDFFQESLPYVCYVTLPGGSCFGSYEQCDSKDTAKQSAAKIALLNSVFNEHPSNTLNSATISKMLLDASDTFPAGTDEYHTNPISVFKEILEMQIGNTMLTLQETMSVFQLLHWNGSLKAMKKRCCSRDEVMQHYTHRNIDADMVSQMSLDWIAREKEYPGSIANELKKCEMELLAARMAGRELRFRKEKLKVLNLAIHRLQNKD